MPEPRLEMPVQAVASEAFPSSTFRLKGCSDKIWPYNGNSGQQSETWFAKTSATRMGAGHTQAQRTRTPHSLPTRHLWFLPSSDTHTAGSLPSAPGCMGQCLDSKAEGGGLSAFRSQTELPHWGPRSSSGGQSRAGPASSATAALRG